MRCRMCGQRAVLRLKAYNINLCQECLKKFVRRRVQKAIRDYRLLKRDDRVLVAVSGGKDSLSLWDLLQGLGYRTKGLYIHLGIGEYSDRSERAVLEFARQRNLEVHIERVRDHFDGLGIPELSRLDHRPPCSLCGMIKRYLMNKVAYEGGWTLATGHNLDDEAAALLGNVLDWKEGYLARQSPRLEPREGFAARVKPLVLCSEREMAAYAISSGIQYILEECPFSHGATSLLYKDLLNQLEEHSPGSKLRFYQNFLKIAHLFRTEQVQLTPCQNCGYPTTGDLCNFCRLKERLSR
ncbi:MAG: TIGR00269 family protein [Deltaproteobacteria bacterium]|nr:MAG: TIGR00269 family protein [Deltaproteobacteria bacterium]